MLVYWSSFCCVKLVDSIYFRTKFSGLEHLPAQGPFILASNHLSNVDPFILGSCRWRRFNYLAKIELFSTPAKAWFFRQVGAIPIKRGTSDFRALRDSLRGLKSGRPLILFPEGTRGHSGRTKEPQPGVGFLALKSKVPVIPVRIVGSDGGLPPGAKWFKFHPIKVIFGEKLEFAPGDDYAQVAQKILTAIYALNP
ncbi:MAG: 1-acyl-sn-glycerol-3-phosphate acyltransferase [Candidatus Omnitrophica bacterium]|nr:1-acyl-sn-glycerol-3-phosphate acyltransferase [Candidatus Omnitrophota bacterium]